MGFFDWIFSHKLLILFIAAATAFGISTVIVAIDKSKLKDDLEACKNSEDAQVRETPTNTEPPNMEKWRLPTHKMYIIIPIKYDLSLYPDLKTGLFKGTVIATIDVKEDSREVQMHSKGLQIEKVDIGGKKAKAEIDEQYELLIITLDDGGVIEKGERVVTIKYNGDMRKGMVGLYTSSYADENGEKRVIATSKFEPTYARKAFPCFDEPDMKANYTVHILKPKDDTKYIALSNMPQQIEETEVENGIMVHFQESVRMSTYLTCFIVCDFDYVETIINPDSDKIPLRVYATPAQVKKTEYAKGVAKGAIEFYLKYFKIDFPLPKLDLIAIPDFVSGAMENWGLITYRETALLFDEAQSSTANKQRVATVVAHELAHSWFGNLVTMKWWNDLWLNEGFATYIEYKGADAVHPDWKMLDQFIIEQLHSVLSLDATPASHPIVQTVVTPDQITELFDSITYSKGASLLRMLEGAIGKKKFQNGVTAYLKKHAWKNAQTQDLWDELQEVVGNSRNVTIFMDTWTVQMGYPILTVKEEGDSYVLTQKRFLKDSKNSEATKSSYQYKWTIPVTYITDKNQDDTKLVWFDYDKHNIKIEKKNAAWIKFNHKQVGYYRVNYHKVQWMLLAANINNLKSISDKTHLLEESFSIAESSDGLLGYNVPLDLTKYLKDETNYIPWSVAATKLNQLKKYLIDSLEYSNYLDYLASIVKPVYEKVTWIEGKNDSHLERKARITILKLACSVELPECKKEASERFQQWLADPVINLLSQDLRTIIYTYGMEESSKTEWKKVLELFKKEIDANEKLNLMGGLAAVKEPWLLRRLIELGRDEQIIRGQDYFTMLGYVSGNPVGTLMVWDYVREHWKYLTTRFSLNDRNLGKLIPSITSSFCTKTKLREMENFFATYPEAGAGAAARKEALANVNNNINWVARNKEPVEKWIKKNRSTSPPTK